MQRIVFLDRESLPVPLRKSSFAHEWAEYDRTSPDEVASRLEGATIAIVNKVKLQGDVLSRLPQLRMIALAATGSDNVDLAYCREHGIAVSNIRDYAGDSLPEHVLALLFALRRGLFGWRQDLKAGLWQQSSQFCLFTRPMQDVAGSRLGIVGRGDLGLSLARKAEALGMTVRFAEHKGAKVVRPGYTDFDEVLGTSDAISLHCPLTAETRGLIGADELARMPRHAVLINTARGALLDYVALLDALREGRLGGAGIDVLPEEPPRQGHPLLEADLPNLIVTPHVAWSSRQAMETMAEQLIGNLEAFCAGVPKNRLA